MKYASSRLQSSTGCQRVKHGPRTILLKLLTILLSGSPFQWWTRQQGPAGPTRQQSQLRKSTSRVQLLSRATSVKIVELAGINQFQMFATVSIKKFPRGINSDQVISCVMTKRRLTSGRAPGPGLKYQATSCKHQASIKLSNQPFQSPSGKHPNQSNKRQASSRKLQAPRSYDHGTWILEKF